MATPQETWTQAVNLASPQYITLVSATAAELEAVGDAINTDATKKAGTLVYVSDVGSVVVSEGPAAADVWNTTAGVTAHSPV